MIKWRVTPSAFALRATADGSADLPDGLCGRSAVQPHFQKYFRSRLTQIKSISLVVPSLWRGVSRSSRTLGAGCGGRGSVGRAMGSQGGFSREQSQSELTNGAFRGRRSRVVLTPRRRRQADGGNSVGDGDNKARSPGRARRKPLKPLRGECRVIPVTCGD